MCRALQHGEIWNKKRDLQRQNSPTVRGRWRQARRGRLCTFKAPVSTFISPIGRAVAPEGHQAAQKGGVRPLQRRALCDGAAMSPTMAPPFQGLRRPSGTLNFISCLRSARRTPCWPPPPPARALRPTAAPAPAAPLAPSPCALPLAGPSSLAVSRHSRELASREVAGPFGPLPQKLARGTGSPPTSHRRHTRGNAHAAAANERCCQNYHRRPPLTASPPAPSPPSPCLQPPTTLR